LRKMPATASANSTPERVRRSAKVMAWVIMSVSPPPP
jgi:hypothetical protein